MLLLLGLIACSTPRAAEADSGWWASAGDLSVEEPVIYTKDAYGLDGGIEAMASDLFPTEDDKLVYAAADAYSDDTSCVFLTDSALPADITGVVTIQPHFYFKTPGCGTDDEKYYGSFFLEDDHSAVFVLGDSKAAHFTVGDTVTLHVRGVRTRYDLDMVYAWDLASVDQAPGDVRYTDQIGAFTKTDIARTRRVEGDVSTTPDTFGALKITGDDGTVWGVQLDAELSRRGVTFALGERIIATGPVLFSYDEYNVVIQSIGQITRVEPD
jgi:hypothetical protein